MDFHGGHKIPMKKIKNIQGLLVFKDQSGIKGFHGSRGNWLARQGSWGIGVFAFYCI